MGHCVNPAAEIIDGLFTRTSAHGGTPTSVPEATPEIFSIPYEWGFLSNLGVFSNFIPNPFSSDILPNSSGNEALWFPSPGSLQLCQAVHHENCRVTQGMSEITTRCAEMGLGRAVKELRSKPAGKVIPVRSNLSMFAPPAFLQRISSHEPRKWPQLHMHTESVL